MQLRRSQVIVRQSGRFEGQPESLNDHPVWTTTSITRISMNASASDYESVLQSAELYSTVVDVIGKPR